MFGAQLIGAGKLARIPAGAARNSLVMRRTVPL